MGSRLRIGGVVVATTAATLAGAGSARVAVDEVRTLAPVADAFVSAAAPRADTRRARVLMASPRPSRRAYVSFAQPVDPDLLVSATLKLHVRRGGADLAVALAQRPWGGGRLGYASAPKPSKPAITRRRLASGTRVSVDVTSLVRARGRTTFVLSSAASRLEFSSAQAGAAVAPRLILVARAPVRRQDPPPPPPPPSEPPGAPAADRTTPTSPTGFRVAGRERTSLTLEWSPASDNVGVAGYRVALAGAGSAQTTNLAHTFGGLACGTTYSATVTARDAAGNESGPATLAPSTAACPRVAAAGDIADATDGDEVTAGILDSLAPDVVLTTGDNAYQDGKLSEYMAYYEPTWGRHKSSTRPSPGNHEYHDPGAAGYFAYFGAAAGPSGRGYYSFDVGNWHLISLNSEIAHGAGSEQLSWLRADLAATSANCVLAYWHRPRFTAGNYTDFTEYTPFWQALYDARAELVLAGHDHNYQRYQRLDPAGARDDIRGLREFVVGTGGRSPHPVAADARRAASSSGVHGVLELTLRSDGYAWRFVGQPGSTFTDSGTGDCR